MKYFQHLRKGIRKGECVLIVLSLKTIPRSFKTFLGIKSGNVNTVIPWASKPFNLLVHAPYCIDPLSNEFFPLIGRVETHGLYRCEGFTSEIHRRRERRSRFRNIKELGRSIMHIYW